MHIYKSKSFLLTALLGLSLLGGCQKEYYLKPTEGVIPIHQPGDSQLDCVQLDQQIGDLQIQIRTMIPPDFTGDAGNQAAMVTGTFLFSPAYLYLLQNEMVDKPRQYERIEAMIRRVEVLQRYKAQRHCFERP